MKNKLNQKGFGAIEAVIILVILIAIGAAGYLVYKDHHKTATAPATSTSTSSNSASTTTTKNGTLYVKEWGQSFKYDDSKATLSYVMADSLGDTIAITSTEYMAANTSCNGALNTDNTPANIARGKPGDPESSTQTWQQALDAGTTKGGSIGGYVYLWTAGSGCAFDSNGVQHGADSSTLAKNVQDAVASIFE